MKKTLLAVAVAGLALGTALTVGTANAAAPLTIIASDMGGKGYDKAVVTVEVSADKAVTAKVVESTGNAGADARLEKLVVGSVNPDLALKGVGEGKGVRYSNVPVRIQYVAAGGCMIPVGSGADIIDPTVVCAPLPSSGFRTGGGADQGAE